MRPSARFLSQSVLRWVALVFLLPPFSSSLSIAQDPNNGPIPFQSLKEKDRQRVQEVIEHPSFSREIKGFKFPSRKEVYEYLLDHPDFAAAVSRALKLSKYQIKKEGDEYWAHDSFYDKDGRLRGVKGSFRVIYADQGKRIYFAQGTYDVKRWLPTAHVRAVFVLEFQHRLDEEGSYVENNLSGYARIDNPFLHFILKILKPLVSKGMEKKIAKTFTMAANVSEQAYRDPSAFSRQLEESQEISPEQLEEFRRVLQCCR